MNRFLLLLSILSFSAQAVEVTESWVCTESSYKSEILVVADVFSGRQTGSIAVAGTVHGADYSVQGFNRRWDFGKAAENGVLPYAFVIKPDGDAMYYDFSNSADGKTSPSQFMFCKQKKSSKK